MVVSLLACLFVHLDFFGRVIVCLLVWLFVCVRVVSSCVYVYMCVCVCVFIICCWFDISLSCVPAVLGLRARLCMSLLCWVFVRSFSCLFVSLFVCVCLRDCLFACVPVCVCVVADLGFLLRAVLMYAACGS